MPTSWKQKPPIAGTLPVASGWPAGVRRCSWPSPAHPACRRRSGPGRRCRRLLPGHPRTRLGRIGGGAARHRRGSRRLWSVWMFSDGTSGPLPPLPRLWPAKIHLPWFAASKRLANTLLVPNPAPVVSSYHVAHGTVLPAPAKSIDGASPSWPWSKFSEPGNSGSRSTGRRPCRCRGSSTRHSQTSARTPGRRIRTPPAGGRSPTERPACRR